MPHILITKLNKNGEKPEKFLVNSNMLSYVNPDNNGNDYSWANMETVDGMVSWRIKESPEEVEALIYEVENPIVIND